MKNKKNLMDLMNIDIIQFEILSYLKKGIEYWDYPIILEFNWDIEKLLRR